MKVELYFWEGCPSYPEALRLLEEVLRERRIDESIELREVRTHEEAVKFAFPGSPTIRVDGRDVDPQGAASAPSLSCRVYHVSDGRVSPIPSRRQLEEAIA